MACPGYQPVFQPQLDGSTLAGFNCTCASGAMAADDDSCGTKRPSSSQVRRWTGDITGGTTLAEVDDALRTHLGIDLDTRYRYPWADFVKRVNGGESAILQGWYEPIRTSRFSGDRNFGGNHAMLVTPGLVVMDPLADGRFGLYKYHGEAYPESLLRQFAGELNIGSGRIVRLGDGLCYASFTRDNEPNYRVVIHPEAGTPGYPTFRYFNFFTVSGGVITARGQKRTGGFSATATAPRLYRWPGHSSQSLVQITSGFLNGTFVRSAWAHPA